jgi:hypothetical protein
VKAEHLNAARSAVSLVRAAHPVIATDGSFCDAKLSRHAQAMWSSQCICQRADAQKQAGLRDRHPVMHAAGVHVHALTGCAALVLVACANFVANSAMCSHALSGWSALYTNTGCQDMEELKRHPFFTGIDWATLRQQKVWVACCYRLRETAQLLSKKEGGPQDQC